MSGRTKNNLAEELSWLESSDKVASLYGNFRFASDAYEQRRRETDSAQLSMNKAYNFESSSAARKSTSSALATVTEVGSIELKEFRMNDTPNKNIASKQFRPHEERAYGLNNRNDPQAGNRQTVPIQQQSNFTNNNNCNKSNNNNNNRLQSNTVPSSMEVTDDDLLNIDFDSLVAKPASAPAPARSMPSPRPSVPAASSGIEALRAQQDAMFIRLGHLSIERQKLISTTERLSDELRNLRRGEADRSVVTRARGLLETAEAALDSLDDARVDLQAKAALLAEEIDRGGAARRDASSTYGGKTDDYSHGKPDSNSRSAAPPARAGMDSWDERIDTFDADAFDLPSTHYVCGGGDADAPLCACSDACAVQISTKERSLGQSFFCCAKGKERGCNFFQWVDQDFASTYRHESSASAAPIPAGARDHLEEIKNRFGHNGFRLGQRECVEEALKGRDVFCLMPTGGGKSVVYQLPAWCTPGLAVVFSPLISLIQDQVDSLLAIGINAAYLSAAQDDRESKAVYSALQCYGRDYTGEDEGVLKMLYITPERFIKSEALRSHLRGIAAQGLLSRFIVDEAHCLSQWGHDFRPDYLSLAGIRKEFPRVPIMALTATANKTVVDDSIRLLGMQRPYVHSQSFNRKNLHYSVLPKGPKDKLIKDIAAIVRAKKNQTGLIYCLSKKDTEEVAEALQLEIPSMRSQITFYHADVKPEQKEKRQRDWSRGVVKVIVATIAFGMGINKPDVRYVVHHSLAKSLTNYYQESGRAGRDGLPSDCIIFFSYKDKSKLAQMIMKPQEAEKRSHHVSSDRQRSQRSGLDNLFKCVSFCINSTDCRRELLLQYFGEKFPAEMCRGTCDNCQKTGPVVEEDYTEEAKLIVRFVGEVCRGGKKGPSITFVKLAKLLGGSRDKESIKFDDITKRVGLKIIKSKEACERLLMKLVIEGYLDEVSEQNTMGFSNDHLELPAVAKPINFERIILKRRDESGATEPRSKASKRPPSAKKAAPHDNKIIEDDGMMVLDSDGDDWVSGRQALEKAAGKAGTTVSKSAKKPPLAKAAKSGLSKVAQVRAKHVSEALFDTSDEEASSAVPASKPKIGSGRKPPTKVVMSIYSDSDEDRHGAANAAAKKKKLSAASSSMLPLKAKQRSTTVMLDSDSDASSVIIPVARAPKAHQSQEESQSSSSSGNGASTDKLSMRQKKLLYDRIDQFRRRWDKYWILISPGTLNHVVSIVPLTRAEFVIVEGFTEQKFTKFGEEFLAMVYWFLLTHDLLHLFPHAQAPTIPPSAHWQDPTSEEGIRAREELMAFDKARADALREDNAAAISSPAGARFTQHAADSSYLPKSASALFDLPTQAHHTNSRADSGTSSISSNNYSSSGAGSDSKRQAGGNFEGASQTDHDRKRRKSDSQPSPDYF